MLRIVPALLCILLLGGCFPFSLFASAGDAYRPYGKSFGMYVANSSVNTLCLAPKLRFAIAEFEGHFGKKVVISSGYRDPFHNASVGGADSSYHMRCMAADFFIPGVPKQRLIAYALRSGAVGGLGCYPGRPFIHIDTRDRPRGWSRPVTFSGC